jgi:diguanylate cyclase (GGDEF)-like protein
VGIIAADSFYFLEKQRMVDGLQELSLEDPLTGLKNRRGFMTLCAQEMETARRWKKDVLVLFMDVDCLKEINDTYGHVEGDEALRAVGRVIRATFRESDVTARFGGDEFAVFCLGSSLGNADDLAGQLRKNMERENSGGDGKYRLSLSVGAAEYRPGSESSLEDMLAVADADMYEKKKARRKHNDPLHQN